MASEQICGIDVPLTRLDYRPSLVRPITIFSYRSAFLAPACGQAAAGCCR
jgi:hypothetical protein